MLTSAVAAYFTDLRIHLDRSHRDSGTHPKELYSEKKIALDMFLMVFSAERGLTWNGTIPGRHTVIRGATRD